MFVNSCLVCLRFRLPLQPVEGLAVGNRFNDSVYLDLKEQGYNQYWTLTDTLKRYSAARLIKTKKSKEIIQNILLMWTSYFGAPNGFE